MTVLPRGSHCPRLINQLFPHPGEIGDVGPLRPSVRERGHASSVHIMSEMDGDEHLNQSEENAMPSSQQEEEAIKKKYGGIVPKKPPLISKASALIILGQPTFREILMQDHERAYFDSADWALGKQGGHAHKPKGPLEALRPKLQPTQQQARSRRSVYASTENEEGGNAASEDISDDNSNNDQ
ncbi:cAMP-regulated phosphoprotein/endosulfine conserved region [Musa troglodytarum]|uniref:cAMP-regulated phosphoprotein/endosulfine conserved region n=1 Tax=Musa troglodytarum TaxID=320322 RepID=A0A9E7H6V7_9LILI|nr:cAMP-regulated phosphoprotein/endosulfine conserved region [Musa troglodytarum]